MSRYMPVYQYPDMMPVDISFVFEDEKPAGKHGFCRAQGENFVFEVYACTTDISRQNNLKNKVFTLTGRTEFGFMYCVSGIKRDIIHIFLRNWDIYI